MSNEFGRLDCEPLESQLLEIFDIVNNNRLNPAFLRACQSVFVKTNAQTTAPPGDRKPEPLVGLWILWLTE